MVTPVYISAHVATIKQGTANLADWAEEDVGFPSVDIDTERAEIIGAMEVLASLAERADALEAEARDLRYARASVDHYRHACLELENRIEVAEDRVAALETALEAILNPKVGPTGFLSLHYGGSGFPEEIARTALNLEKDGT